jgi:hypothetical protein
LKLQEQKNNLIIAKNKMALDWAANARADKSQQIDFANLDLNTLKTLSEIPEGKTITVNGAKSGSILLKSTDPQNLEKSTTIGREVAEGEVEF